MATILVVDDSPVIRRLLRVTLNRHGFAVLTAGSGADAQDTLRHESVDLLLLDIEMPGMDGLALLKHVRADPRLGSLPVVMLTASGEVADRQRATRSGASGFLNKPASASELLDLIGQLVPRADGGAGEEPVDTAPPPLHAPASSPSEPG